MPLLVPSVAAELKWSKTDSGTVLSSFFWGYTLTQVTIYTLDTAIVTLRGLLVLLYRFWVATSAISLVVSESSTLLPLSGQ